MKNSKQHSIEWQRIGHAVIARVAGRIDSSNAFDFDREVQSKIQKSDEVLILDCARLTYISSAGLRVTLRLAKAFAPPKRFALCSLSESINEVVSISGFDRVIAVFDSAEKALAAG